MVLNQPALRLKLPRDSWSALVTFRDVGALELGDGCDVRWGAMGCVEVNCCPAAGCWVLMSAVVFSIHSVSLPTHPTDLDGF